MPQQPTKGEKQTLIEQGTEFKGTMKSTCPVVVNGRVEGELTAPDLEVTRSGFVRGNIKAERLSSRGTLSGNVEAGELLLSGSVGEKTTIKAKSLEVKLASDPGRLELTIGECTLDIGDEPTRERRASMSPVSEVERTSVPPPIAVAGGDEAPAAEGADAGQSALGAGSFPLAKTPGENNARGSVPPGR